MLLHQTAFENLRLFFICTRLGNVQNTAGVNTSRCCAITEILWNPIRLPEILKFKQKSETATLSELQESLSQGVMKFTILMDTSLAFTTIYLVCLIYAW